MLCVFTMVVTGKVQSVLQLTLEPLLDGIINQTYVKTTKRRDFVALVVSARHFAVVSCSMVNAIDRQCRYRILNISYLHYVISMEVIVE